MAVSDPMADDTPADRHRRYAGAFSERVRGTRDWTVPAPVAGWTAHDVVRHLVEWFPAFLASGSDVRLPPGPSVDDDPVAAWQHQVDAVQAVLDDPGTASRTLSNPHIGEVPLDEAVDRFYTSDVFLHTWDLARATGQDETLDPDKCAELLAGMEPIEDVLRASGQYGPRVEVPADADVQTRLLGFIGRAVHPGSADG
jgi:uncharacterized protein (TIGR03086 family)